MEVIDMLEMKLGHSIGLDRAALNSLNNSGQLGLLHEYLVKEGVLPRRSGPDLLRGPLRAIAAALRTIYIPEKVYVGPVKLVMADDPELSDDANKQRQATVVANWKKWIPNVTVVLAPGNHMTMLTDPHANELARILRQCASVTVKKWDCR